MWYVYAERKSRVPHNKGAQVKVKLKAPRGRSEASAMAGHLTGFGWIASIDEVS